VKRLWHILIAFDQLVNTLLFFLPGGAWPDETFSSRCWRHRDRFPFTFIRPVIDRLFFWQDGHCRRSFEAEQARRHQPIANRIGT
jgi:hypothetical protein